MEVAQSLFLWACARCCLRAFRPIAQGAARLRDCRRHHMITRSCRMPQGASMVWKHDEACGQKGRTSMNVLADFCPQNFTNVVRSCVMFCSGNGPSRSFAIMLSLRQSLSS